MSSYYDQPGWRQRGPEDVAGVLVLFACAAVGFCWYVAVSRLHLRNVQCLEIFLYVAILFFGGGLIIAQLVGRRKKREEHWPHPAIVIPASKDSKMVADASQAGATLLGYNVHKEPWLWPDTVRMKHGVIVGGTGAGKSTFLENIIAQDLTRRFGARKMPMIIFDGKGEREFLDRLLPHIEAAGRLQDLRVIDPTHPSESARYNPFYALDDAYQEHVNFIFRSFGLREDFFKGHQEAYLSDLVRILQYTGKLFNVYDVLVMALDEQVLQEQIAVAKARLASLPGISMQKRLNFEMSVKMLQRSLSDRERVEKIQGLLNELLSFLEDELSIVTGSYQDLLTLDDVLEKDLILFVSLNANRNQRAVEALGKILLQNIQLMVGKRYAQPAGDRDADEPMLSVILDEFAPFAYPGFTQVLQAMYAKFCVNRETANNFMRLFVNRRAYAIQAERPLPNGSVPYYPARDWKTKELKPLDEAVVRMHLNGDITISLYAINPETQRSKWVAIDADFDGSLESLFQLQWELKQDGVDAALEQSRRGGHLWIFCAEPLLASECRIYVYNLALRLGIPVKGGGLKEGIEVFPRQDRLDDGELGNAIRGPIGVHRKTNRRYWFYEAEPTPEAQLAYLNGLKKLTESELRTFIEGMSLPEAYRPVVAVPYTPPASSSPQQEFRILDYVRTTRKDSRNWWAKCPSCAGVGRDRAGDNLAIQIKNPRFYKCWAGCTKEEIRAALGQPIRKRVLV